MLLVCVRLHIGLIPAHAGKTSSASSARVDSRAHPRSRGENYRDGNHLQLPEGSSPLTRGKQILVLGDPVEGGLIPAHAGKTGSGSRSPPTGAAHPRSRGENILSHATKTLASGSSPLTRGKHGQGPARYHSLGLIPAHAGKTDTWVGEFFEWRAHPRSRGENRESDGEASALAGSSPLTRGKLTATNAPINIGGLIPAHAGKTS